MPVSTLSANFYPSDLIPIAEVERRHLGAITGQARNILKGGAFAMGKSAAVTRPLSLW